MEEIPLNREIALCEENGLETKTAWEVTNGSEPATSGTNGVEARNGRILKRIETIPDIKRDTSGISTQYLATGIVNLGAFASGVCIAWSSSALPLLTAVHHEPAVRHDGSFSLPEHPPLSLTPYEASWVASLLNLGAFSGAVPAGLISEYFGRKKTLLYLALPMLVSWILIASSPNVYGLYVGRFVGGVAVGAFSVAIPPYVADIAEPSVRTSLANFFHVQFMGGILFGYIIEMVHSATILSVICAGIPITFFVAFLFLPESPVYLMSQGKSNEAKASLRYFRGIDNNIDEEMADVREHIRNSFKNKATFNDLLSNQSAVKALIVSFGLVLFQQCSGIYPVLFYAEEMFKTFGVIMSPGAAIILGFFLVTSTYFSTMLLKNMRRRLLLMTSFAVMALSTGSLAIYYHMTLSRTISQNTWAPLFFMCLFVSVYAMGVGPIPWLMLREIFPPNMTRRATAITAGFHWFLAFGVTKLYQNLINEVKPGWVLLNFAIGSVIGAIFVYFFVPETKNKTLEEIQNEFRGIHKKKKHRHIIEVESASES